MKKALTWVVLFLFTGLILPTFIGCQTQPTVTTNPDITGNILGGFTGNYVANYEMDPTRNYSSQINLVVSKIDVKKIRIDAQGGDSFECTISGSSTNLKLTNITNTSGVYKSATDIEGYYISGSLYYKVTGIVDGGNFYAEFTVI